MSSRRGSGYQPLRTCERACAYINLQIDAFLEGFGRALVLDLQHLVAEWVIQDPDLQMVLNAWVRYEERKEICPQHNDHPDVDLCELLHCSKITQELCYALFDVGGAVTLETIPSHFMTYEMCLTAAGKRPYSLQRMPRIYKTFEVLAAAVAQNPEELKCIDEPSLALCHWVLALNPKYICWINKEPMPNFFRMVVKKWPWAAMFLPDKYATEEMLLVALEVNGCLLSEMKDVHKSERACRVAVTQTWKAIEFVPPDKLTRELADLALQQDPLAMDLIKKTF